MHFHLTGHCMLLCIIMYIEWQKIIFYFQIYTTWIHSWHKIYTTHWQECYIRYHCSAWAIVLRCAGPRPSTGMYTTNTTGIFSWCLWPGSHSPAITVKYGVRMGTPVLLGFYFLQRKRMGRLTLSQTSVCTHSCIVSQQHTKKYMLLITCKSTHIQKMEGR